MLKCHFFQHSRIKSHVHITWVSFMCWFMMDDKTSMHSMMFLDSTNYVVWKTKMEDILYIKDLYEPTTLNEIISTVQNVSK